MSLKKDILWRVGVVYFFILFLGIAIIARVFYLQFFEGSKWKEMEQKVAYKNIVINANRGDIKAEDGRLLSTSVPFYDVHIDMLAEGITQSVLLSKIDSLAYSLSNLFEDKSAYQYKSLLMQARKSKNRYFLLKRDVSYDKLKQLKTFPIFNMGKYKGGLIYTLDYNRIKPHGNCASRTIGYLSKSESGNVVGIEGSFDQFLKGVEGVRLMQRIPGNVWMPVGRDNEIEPQDGNDVITTIDVRIQDVAQAALLKQLQLHEAQHGTAILMEVKTGKIRAIANLERDSYGFYHESYNYAIGESTEPGSTFKLPALMVAMEDGYVDLNDSIDTGKGIYYVFDKKITDTKEGGLGKITVQQVFEYSSNVGMAKIIYGNYKGKEKQFVDRLYNMNLNQVHQLDIRGEGSPDIKYPGSKLWSGISLAMMSSGYEVKLTPLQTLAFYNAVANEGVYVKPIFVSEIQFRGKTIKTYEPIVLNSSICSRKTLKSARLMLEGVVENGTAKNLKNVNYKIAGKTGTAQIFSKESGYKGGGRITYLASFCGYFPAENPKYSCIVVISAPTKSVYYGNLVAGPVFKEIADKVFSTSAELQPIFDVDNYVEVKRQTPFIRNGYKKDTDKLLKIFDIPKTESDIISSWVSIKNNDSIIDVNNINIYKGYVPNVVGMGLKDAVFLLENNGIKVGFNGRGVVARQSIPAGVKISRGDKIYLELKI